MSMKIALSTRKNRSIPQIQFIPFIIQFLGYLPYCFDLKTLSGKLKTYKNVKGICQKKLRKILGVEGAIVSS
jgi:hypothetical protein